MEIKIGVQNVAREVVLESSQSAEEVAAIIDAALTSGSVLRLKDEKGREVVVPTDRIGYVDIGAPKGGRVGFGTL